MWRHLESNQKVSFNLFDAILIGNVGVPGEYNQFTRSQDGGCACVTCQGHRTSTWQKIFVGCFISLLPQIRVLLVSPHRVW